MGKHGRLVVVADSREFQSAQTALASDLVVPMETVQNAMKDRAKKKGGHDDEDKPCVKGVDPSK